jgi:dolichyl-diphosphooligosaccharide--protein glycosyltransferase
MHHGLARRACSCRFNFRATKYLWEEGWTKFFHWYDHMSWYPLGRPVGTTIYPGMQITSCVICKALEMLGTPMSLNDVCVFVPAWFGVIATTFLALLAGECAGFASAGVGAALVMSIIPAHIMRSVAGGYDNESVAVTALCATFYFWCRSLRNDSSWWIGVFTGLAYTYMVMVWGGYIFVVNMIGVHAGILWITGCHSTKLHRAYSLFYVIGTFGAVHVPVVGWAPLKSLEQLGPFGVFVALNCMEFCEEMKRRKNLSTRDLYKLRLAVFGAIGAVLAVIAVILLPTGYFGPLSARVRGLFVRHTRTGNPLVDSVAEHQPASPQAYWQYLHYMCYCAPVGYALCLVRSTPVAKVLQALGAGPWWGERGDAKLFLITYASIGYFFSNKMVRLVLLMGPIASALGGIALGACAEWCVWQAAMFIPSFGDDDEEEEVEGKDVAKKGGGGKDVAKKKEEEEEQESASKKSKKRGPSRGIISQRQKEEMQKAMGGSIAAFYAVYDSYVVRILRIAAVLCLSYTVRKYADDFSAYCNQLAHGMSNPSLVFKAHLNNGQVVTVNDYMEAYHWLRDRTPKDARVMSWYIYVCMYVYKYIYIYMHVYVYLCIYMICTCVYSSVCVCV